MDSAVLGRDAELRIVHRMLESVAVGPAACVLEGEAGIGKTALWRAGVMGARAAGTRVVSCAPAEVEAVLAYSCLADLLADVEPEIIDALPEPQRAALEVAMLLSARTDAVAGQRAVATAFVSVLRRLAESTPVVVAIDDVQWLDPASARVLDFAVRRLEGRPVGFLLTLRPGRPTPLGLDRALAAGRCELVRVGPLSVGALHQLLKQRLAATFARAELLRIHRETSGNPLFALELASSLLHSGPPGAGGTLPVPDDVRELVAARLKRLPAVTRDTLFFAALMPDPGIDGLAAAMRAAPGEVAARLTRAQAAGVIRVDGESIRFEHPLFAAAIVAARSNDARRQAHGRLAELAQTAEQHARHLALCREGPDLEVALTVAAAAADLRRRGAPEAAVELAELAIDLTPVAESDERDRRVLELGYYLMEAGDSERAGSVLREVAQGDGALRGRALLDLAGLDYWREGSVPAIARCEEALVAAAGDAALEAACHAELAVYCDNDSARSERHAGAALALLEAAGESADPDVLVDALLATARAGLVMGRGLSGEVVERAFVAEARATTSIVRSRVGSQLGQWLKYVDDFDGARRRLEDAQSQALQEGDESSFPNQLMHLAQLECWSGNVALAAGYAAESFELAEQLGQSFGGPSAMRALIDVHAGDGERARATIDECLARSDVAPSALPLYLRALGFLELSLGAAPAAARHLSRTLELAEQYGILEPAVYRVHADLIEALVTSGELGRAAEVLAAFERQSDLSRVPWSLATRARCRALLLAARGELDAAELAFGTALDEHKRCPVPFERARTLLALSGLQRRRNERRRAHESLAQAIAAFGQLGTPLWLARAERELRPLGGRPTSPLALTAAEQRVAELVAGGLTNREVAARLFISPKTVESSLARAYRKLDVHSRAELGARIALDSAGGDDPAARRPLPG
jgi:DNA-binding CsgD family transcriptional regulator